MSIIIHPACNSNDCVLINLLLNYVIQVNNSMENTIRDMVCDVAKINKDIGAYVLDQSFHPFPPCNAQWYSSDMEAGVKRLETVTVERMPPAPSTVRDNLLSQEYTIIGNHYVPLTACPQTILDVQLQKSDLYHLWVNKYCRVDIGDAINYLAVGYYLSFSNPVEQLAANLIMQQFRASASLIDPSKMTQACQVLSYDSMKNTSNRDLCGCYTTLPPSQYTSDEIQQSTTHPACLPSCLDAALKRYSGGNAENCNQNLCIIDNVVTSGASVTITNECPICSNNGQQCVCYIHVDQAIVSGESACGTVYTVDPSGRITSTSKGGSSDDPQPAGLDLILIISLSVTLFAAAIILIVILLLRQHFSNRTSKQKNQKFNPIGLSSNKK